MSASGLIARKEASALLLTQRGLMWLMGVAIGLSTFGLLLVGNIDLSRLDNAQVVYDMTVIVTALGSVLALTVGVDSVAGERERGSLLPLLLTPASRTAILIGKLAGVAIAWAVTVVLSVPYLWAVGRTGRNMTDAIAVLALFGTPVVLAFGFLGIGLGSRLASARAALLTGLAALVVSAGPLLLRASLQQSAIGRMFDGVNPFSVAAHAYGAVIVESQSSISHGIEFLVCALWLLAALWFASAMALTHHRRVIWPSRREEGAYPS